MAKYSLPFVMLGVAALATPHLLPSAQIPSSGREIVAERITIKDKAGNTRAVWNESGLALFDVNGKIRVGVGTVSDGSPVISLYETSGEPRALMRLNPDGSSQFQLTNARAKAGLTLSDKGSGLVLIDQQGSARLSLGTDAAGSPGLLFLDDSRARLAINFGSRKEINLGLLGSDDKPKILLSVSDKNAPSITLLDMNGAVKNKID